MYFVLSLKIGQLFATCMRENLKSNLSGHFIEHEHHA